MRKEVVVAQFEVLPPAFAWGGGETKKILLETRTGYFQNTSLKRYNLSQFAQ
jgi:hypothetical protein